MASIPSTTPPRSTQLSSFEAYVVPHLVEVSAGTSGKVRSVIVSPHGVVRRGETVALLDPHPPGDGPHPSVAVKAPVAGLVTSCWTAPGALLAGNGPIVTIASSENVLVLARFSHGTRIQRGGAATVRFGGDEGPVALATIISAVEAPDAEAVAVCTMRVVLAVRDAPAKALWPGTPARVTIGP